ncbi:hypothetical protein CC78DRAFT_588086 [Lojkania enalia]|uniref:Uncharacterized protein n=1 Tax=Lojkania enalia TaxID=147567 RepID=A0A9P4N417_9PLEO|nr:hypothetical protein CC78DRAFT_588086 [Didymosphaeria enalia]
MVATHRQCLERRVAEKTEGRTIRDFIRRAKHVQDKINGYSLPVWILSTTPDRGNPMRALTFFTTTLHNPKYAGRGLERIDEDHAREKKAFDRLFEKVKVNLANAEGPEEFQELTRLLTGVLPHLIIRGCMSVALECRRQYAERKLQLKDHDAGRRLDGKRPAAPNMAKAKAYFNAVASASVARSVDPQARLGGRGNCSRNDETIERWSDDPHSEHLIKILDEAPVDNDAKVAKTYKLLRMVQDTPKKNQDSRSKAMVAASSSSTQLIMIIRVGQLFEKQSMACYTSNKNNKEAAINQFTLEQDCWIFFCTRNARRLSSCFVARIDRARRKTLNASSSPTQSPASRAGCGTRSTSASRSTRPFTKMMKGARDGE